MKASSHDLVSAVAHLQEQLKEERKKRETAESNLVRGGGSSGFEPIAVGAVKLWVKRFEDIDSKVVAQTVDDHVSRDASLVVLVAIVGEGKIQYIAKAGKQAVAAGAHAGNLAGQIAKLTGGGGGGRPDFATAGGKDASGLDAALSDAPSWLKAQVGGS